jgi:hypothetical protein
MAGPPAPSPGQIADALIPTISIIVGVASVLTASIGVFTAFRLNRKRVGITSITEPSSSLNNNLSLFQEYHSQGLRQANFSFNFSIAAACVGFSMICLSILLTYFQYVGQESSLSKPIFVLTSGTIVDAVAGLFFIQSNKTRNTMVAFFDKLRTDRKLDEALSLVNAITNADHADRLRMLLSMKFAEIAVSANMLNELSPDDNSTSDTTTRSDLS